MDMTLIQGTISGLKAAGDIAKSIFDLKVSVEVKGKIIDLQNAILSAQNSALAANADQQVMVEEIRALKKKIADVKAWEAQKQRYKLTPLWNGPVVVYALKESLSEGEPPHWICTKCYEHGERMILQPRRGINNAYLVCPNCKSEVRYSRIWCTGGSGLMG
jgi:hypothetical protein